MQFGNGCMSNGLREVSPRLSPSLRRADCEDPMHAARSAFNEITHMVLSFWIARVDGVLLRQFGPPNRVVAVKAYSASLFLGGVASVPSPS